MELMFATLIVSYIMSKYILNMNMSEKHKIKNIISICIYIYVCFFICFLCGFALNNFYIMIISFIGMIILFFREIIFSFMKLYDYNREFKVILINNDYNDIKRIKKEMIFTSLSNILLLMASPLIFLERGIVAVLCYIFK